MLEFKIAESFACHPGVLVIRIQDWILKWYNKQLELFGVGGLWVVEKRNSIQKTYLKLRSHYLQSARPPALIQFNLIWYMALALTFPGHSLITARTRR
jgi:hypothetical protein